MNIYIKEEEAKFLAIAIVSLLKDLNESSKDEKLPFNPMARKYLREMSNAGNSIRQKFSKLGFDMSDFDAVTKKDIYDFFTKES